MSRPADREFIKWNENDSNLSIIRNALETFPDLLMIKGYASFSLRIIFIIIFIIV